LTSDEVNKLIDSAVDAITVPAFYSSRVVESIKSGKTPKSFYMIRDSSIEDDDCAYFRGTIEHPQFDNPFWHGSVFSYKETACFTAKSCSSELHPNLIVESYFVTKEDNRFDEMDVHRSYQICDIAQDETWLK